jgi:hypothetical protein
MTSLAGMYSSRSLCARLYLCASGLYCILRSQYGEGPAVAVAATTTTTTMTATMTQSMGFMNEQITERTLYLFLF